ncbi:MAG: hypothetical protein NW224_14280 [Leptolyngbyaceae cyanobacterium bins.302]|nr:hypothetical protein [Leptolyngbyaceae cyanobacterium bins.302]
MQDPVSVEFQRLLNYLQEQAVDSQEIPVTSVELPTLAICLIHRMILQHPLLNEIIQEELDNLRYKIHGSKSPGLPKIAGKRRQCASSAASEV